ncbi:MAG: flagellar biosynthesis protein FlhF [Nitrospiraceae bacterium]|nr:MAG: flagellar biosynthesis protein FlhF [Nitrospiraceae bacterium]
MKIKKIRAKNFSDALAQVKKELGSDAVILSSEDRKGTRPYVEVTAGVDYDIETGIASAPSRQLLPSVSGPDEYVEIRNELRNLKDYIEAMKDSGFELKLHGERKNLFNFLKERSIKDEYALNLVKRARDISDIETIMSDDLNIERQSRSQQCAHGSISSDHNREIKMLIGPTGSGKTTTLAKLASRAIREGKKVAFISIDTYKIGAAEQIRIYSRMIGIPLDIVSDRDGLRKSISRLSDRDVLLVDTTGQNPRDTKYIDKLKALYEMHLPLETQLLLSTSSDCEFLMDTYKYYNSLPIDYVAFTKTDEAVKLGSIYNLCSLYQKPVAYITTGQRVPGNIEFVDSRKLTNLILRTGSA